MIDEAISVSISIRHLAKTQRKTEQYYCKGSHLLSPSSIWKYNELEIALPEMDKCAKIKAMQSNTVNIGLILCLFMTPGCSQDRDKPFRIVIQHADQFLSLECEQGCDWGFERFDCPVEGCITTVNQSGVSSRLGEPSSSLAGATRVMIRTSAANDAFEFTITPKDQQLQLSCQRGCSWKFLAVGCEKEGCIATVDRIDISLDPQISEHSSIRTQLEAIQETIRDYQVSVVGSDDPNEILYGEAMRFVFMKLQVEELGLSEADFEIAARGKEENLDLSEVKEILEQARVDFEKRELTDTGVNSFAEAFNVAHNLERDSRTEFYRLLVARLSPAGKEVVQKLYAEVVAGMSGSSIDFQAFAQDHPEMATFILEQSAKSRRNQSKNIGPGDIAPERAPNSPTNR